MKYREEERNRKKRGRQEKERNRKVRRGKGNEVCEKQPNMGVI
jgi:hypothetical protein